MLKLKQTNIEESISIKDMRVGQIGIITEWGIQNTYKGKTVIRAYRGLVDVFTGDLWGNQFL